MYWIGIFVKFLSSLVPPTDPKAGQGDPTAVVRLLIHRLNPALRLSLTIQGAVYSEPNFGGKSQNLLGWGCYDVDKKYVFYHIDKPSYMLLTETQERGI